MLTLANISSMFHQSEDQEHGFLHPSPGFCVRGGTLPPTYLGPPPPKQVRCLDVEWTKRKVHYSFLLYDIEEMVVN